MDICQKKLTEKVTIILKKEISSKNRLTYNWMHTHVSGNNVNTKEVARRIQNKLAGIIINVFGLYPWLLWSVLETKEKATWLQIIFLKFTMSIYKLKFYSYCCLKNLNSISYLVFYTGWFGNFQESWIIPFLFLSPPLSLSVSFSLSH